MRKTIIDADENKIIPDFRELFRYKDLFLTLTWRDFRVRYAQTSLGFLWAFIQPCISIALLTFIFGTVAETQTEGIPRVLFTASGVGLWIFFAFVMTHSGESIIASQSMIKKVYFPKLIIPLSKAVVGFVELGITLIIIGGLMIYYQVIPSVNVWLTFGFIILGVMAALGVGIWLSALTVRYRDFKHIVPFIVQIGYFVTPIGYPASLVPESIRGIYFLNPMAGVVQGFRWSLLGTEPPGNMIFVSIGMVLILFITGLLYFKRVEDTMADLV